MNNSNKVSIIVPVYGVEAYLPACVDSLLAQTYKNLEIILVDDESPDGCPAICDAYAVQDPRVTVIHKKNGGAASARNVGLDAARGDYISLVDSDDWVSKNFIEFLLQLLWETHSDVSVCSFSNVFRNGRTENPIAYPHLATVSQVDFLERFLVDWTCGMATNKLFRADVLNNVRYEEGHKIDDEFFTYKAIMNCNQVVISDEILYWYRMRKSSVMTSASQCQERILRDKLEYLESRYRDVGNRYPELRTKYLANFADNLIRLRGQSTEYPVLWKRINRKMMQYLFAVMTAKSSLPQKHSFLRNVVPLKTQQNHIQELPIRSTEMNYFE